MTDKFINQCRIVVTPLSPIHIGSGEDLIPTNYYMDNGVIHIFDPFKLNLPEDKRDQLLKLAQKDSFWGVYRFFYNHQDLLRHSEISVIPVDREIEDKYQEILKNSESDNKCQISRTSVTSIHGYEQPYIPGSSLKGALHTAILYHFSDPDYNYRKNKKNIDFDKELLGAESFAKSPMRFLKVSDLMPAKSVYSRVIKSVRERKQNQENNGAAKKGQRTFIPSYVEIIDKAQYRAFEGTISFISSEKSSVNHSKCIDNSRQISECMQDFYYDNIYEFIQGDENWFKLFEDLENALESEFDSGKCFIARFGKYQGMESVTLDVIDHVKTFTRAKEISRRGLIEDLPFGLALVEIDPVGENKALKDYCECCRASMKDFKLKDVREKLFQGKV